MKTQALLQLLAGIFACGMWGFITSLLFNPLISLVFAFIGGAILGGIIISPALQTLFFGEDK